MAQATHYDSIVIGSGQGGTPLAGALAKAGRKTALIERRYVGGTCVNTGCTPTKTMYASAKVAQLARRGVEFGVRAGPVHAELGSIRQRKQAIVEMFRAGSRSGLESTANLDLIEGSAAFTGPHALEVTLAGGGKQTLTASNVFINTGARSAPLSIEGGDRARVVDHAGLMELNELPSHLVVLGGGYIGVEFGQMFRRFGSQVTIIQRGDQLLPQEDRDVAEEIAKILRDDGVELLLSGTAKSIESDESGAFEVLVETPSGDRGASGDVLLNAAGRVPNTDMLQLDRAGVELDERGYIRVDDRLATNVPGIWALGDVKGGPAFTHISYDDYRVLKANVIDGGNATTRGRMVPYAVFIDPQLGRVGLSEKQALAQKVQHRVAKMEMSHIARATESGETRGFIKAIIEQGSDKILGCAVLGMEGGELMAMVQIAMLGGLTAPQLRDAIFAHPTLAEGLNSLFG